MRWLEAIQYLNKGKTIRRESWPEGNHVTTHGPIDIYGGLTPVWLCVDGISSLYAFTVQDRASNNWEIMQ